VSGKHYVNDRRHWQELYTPGLIWVAGLVIGVIAFTDMAVVIWQLRNTNNDRRRAALRVISVSFFMLAGYITVQSGWALWNQRHPLNSHLGLT